MNILALDTSTTHAALALARSDGLIFTSQSDPKIRHGRALVASIRDLLVRAGLSTGDLNLLAVGLGPGSYTGLRIGLAAAKTLAYVLKAPLVGIDSLEVIARNAPSDSERVSVIADAQRGELYTADFVREPGNKPLQRATPTRTEPIPAWLARLMPGTFVVGPGIERLKEPLPPTVTAADASLAYPAGHHLLALAQEAFLRGQRDDPWLLEPLYLRRSAAEEKWDKK
ncbi:MAG TPA: tRNA (adenosine(37)-N6)-threonylcarbamoyltransferase complex dimerization subunit type 1 TsaB [Isosphaeraceae bacterium]|nr:tRNA (adenosine(37)-N6)-threonylcarbamoyltransferase complex dimerization subunit type 1 TsaB [Isosphaeraceae bacterium]